MNFLKKYPAVVIFLGTFLAVGLLIGLLFFIDDEKMKDYAQGWDIPGASEALKESPNEPSAHIAMASAWMKHKEFTNAIAEYQKAIQLEPSNPYTHLDLGNAFASTGQLSKARSQWQLAVRLNVPGGDAAKEASSKLVQTAAPSK